MSETEILAALSTANRERCVPALPEDEVRKIAKSIAQYGPDPMATAMAENHWGQICGEEAESEEACGHPDPGPVPDHLRSVPGFINSVIDHTLATAPHPNRVLAFCGALSLQAVLAGQKVRDPSDNRTNLYVLGLANSGAGKDHPRKVNQKILEAAGMADQLGDSFASGEGIEDRLFSHSVVLYQTDEIDGLLKKN